MVVHRQQARDRAGQAALQPITGIAVLRADHESIVAKILFLIILD